jgi:predicted DNA binding CopG/RHH family protein
LRIDRAATNKLRASLAKSNRVTITVNLDTESLQALKTLSVKTGIPYQRLLNRLLTTNAARQETVQTRLNRLEQELRKIKRRFAA